jgi:hypothetical protein
MGADAQLELIRDVSTALASAGVDHWLTGGWAVDFLRGAVSRPHKDVDLVIWGADAAKAGAALSQAGFRRVDDAFSDERLVLERSGVDVELIFVVRDAAARLVTPGRWLDWPWPEDTLSGPVGRIGEVSCRVVSLAAQIDSKKGYEASTSLPPRSQDLHDLELLETFDREG